MSIFRSSQNSLKNLFDHLSESQLIVVNGTTRAGKSELTTQLLQLEYHGRRVFVFSPTSDEKLIEALDIPCKVYKTSSLNEVKISDAAVSSPSLHDQRQLPSLSSVTWEIHSLLTSRNQRSLVSFWQSKRAVQLAASEAARKLTLVFDNRASAFRRVQSEIVSQLAENPGLRVVFVSTSDQDCTEVLQEAEEAGINTAAILKMNHQLRVTSQMYGVPQEVVEDYLKQSQLTQSKLLRTHFPKESKYYLAIVALKKPGAPTQSQIFRYPRILTIQKRNKLANKPVNEVQGLSSYQDALLRMVTSDQILKRYYAHQQLQTNESAKYFTAARLLNLEESSRNYEKICSLYDFETNDDFLEFLYQSAYYARLTDLSKYSKFLEYVAATYSRLPPLDYSRVLKEAFSGTNYAELLNDWESVAGSCTEAEFIDVIKRSASKAASHRL